MIKSTSKVFVKPLLRILILTVVILCSYETGFAINLVSIENPNTQDFNIRGQILDNNGIPLPGATILERGTNNGAQTDFDGNFTLTVRDRDAVLVISYLGYVTQEVQVQGQENIVITLTEDAAALDEVIVVGYGTQKQSDLTGSVTRVTMDDRANQANTTLFQALSGAAAGVNVQNAGMAGGEANLSVRGQTSLSASDQPLVVVDGIIFNGSVNDINPNDVESIDILKGASAAAVYGSRSANGVMLITTKRGRSQEPVVSFNAYYGFQDMTNNPMRVMNAEEYGTRLVDYYYQQDLYSWYYTNPTSPEGRPVRPDVSNPEVVAARLRTEEERANYLAGVETDWVDAVTRIAPIENYNLSVSQRTENSNYFVSGSYTHEDGILLNDSFSRFTVRANLESNITDWLTFGVNTSYSYRDYSGLESSLWFARRASPLANNMIGSPDYQMYLTGENYMEYPLNNLHVDNSDIRNNLFLVGRAKVEVPWIEGLSYELNYSNTYNTRSNNSFYPVNTPEGADNQGLATKEPVEGRDWIVNNIVSYNRDFDIHSLNATLLYSREHRQGNGSNLTSQGFENDILGYNNMALGTIFNVGSFAWEENSISYMARANYTFDDRYLLTATIRRDGFSGFAQERKFANFPSISVGWRISDESFFDEYEGTFLKLRASYGKNGNQGIGRYSSFSRMALAPYVYGPETSIGLYPNSLGNPNLGWETTSSYNFGVDYSFWNRRIQGSVDAYTSETTDVLVMRTLPPATGYGTIWENIGGIANRGVEAQISTVNIEGDFRWESSFIFSLNRNEITRLYGDGNDQDIGNEWFVGESISAIYDYEMAGGVWTEEDLYSGNILNNWYPGQFRYVDQNGDGAITPSEDRTIIGYRDPNYRFSINNILTYKNLTFSVFVNSIQGGNGYYMMNNSSVVNVSWNSDDVYRINASAVRPYWTPENGVTNATGVYNTPVQSSGIYEDRSFVRLQDITLAYNFDPGFLERLSISNLQVHISGKNLYTWTDWSGWDPETVSFDGEGGSSPLMRNITTGISLTF